jgi:hypothetical protein
MRTINLSVNSHDRLQISTTIEQLINMLDDLDGDPDFEPEETDQNGDESDHSRVEDEGYTRFDHDGSGVREANRLLATIGRATP